MNRGQPILKPVTSMIALITALGAISLASCQKGADEAKPGPLAGAKPQTPAPPPAVMVEDLPALSQAALKVDVDKAKQLIASGADVNKKDERGTTALIYAAGNNDKTLGGGFAGRQAAPVDNSDELVRLLLSHHADPNATSLDGTTPLLAVLAHRKILSGPPDLPGSQTARINKVTMLLAAGAKVNVATSQESSDNLRAGTTPLMAAAVNGNKILVQMLITKGADVNAKDQSGNTALIDAAHVGNADAVQLLIASHADVNASNTKGSTALSEAMRMKSSGLARCADLLRSAGAKG